MQDDTLATCAITELGFVRILYQAPHYRTGRQTTDGHLLRLAESHGARLATLDPGIPGAFLIPPIP